MLLILALIMAGCGYSYMRPKEESSLDNVQQLGQTIAAGQVAQTATAAVMPTSAPTMMPETPSAVEKTSSPLATSTSTLTPTPTFSWLVGPAATTFISATLTPASIRTPQPTAPYQVTLESPATLQGTPAAAPTWTSAPVVPYVPGSNTLTATPTTSSSISTATPSASQATVPDWSWELVDGNIEASGTVANESSQAMVYVRINLLLLDADGGFIATVGTYADAIVIQPGEASPWSLQEKAPDGLSSVELSKIITWEWYE